MKKLFLFALLTTTVWGTFAQSKLLWKPLNWEWQNISVLSKVTGCDDCNVPILKPYTVFPINRLELNNFTIGPSALLTNSNSILDFELGLPLKKTVYTQFMIVDENNEVVKNKRIKHRFWSFSPTLDVKLKLNHGGYNSGEKGSLVSLYFGASYDMQFSYNRSVGYYGAFVKYFQWPESVGRDTDNMSGGGLNLRAGIALDRHKDQRNRLHTFKIGYTHALYNPWNTEYMYKGEQLYKDWKTQLGTITFTWGMWFGEYKSPKRKKEEAKKKNKK